MHLYPIKKQNTTHFLNAIDKDKIGGDSPESFVNSLHHACCVPNGEVVYQSLNPFIPQEKGYDISIHISENKDRSSYSYRMANAGVIRTTQESKWVKANNAQRTLEDITSVMQMIIMSEYLNFSMLTVDKEAFSFLFENEMSDSIRVIDGMRSEQQNSIGSLLSLTYQHFRPYSKNLSEATAKEKREFIRFMLDILQNEAEHFNINEIYSICSTLESDFGAIFKNELANRVQSSQNWNMRYFASYITKRCVFARTDKGITAFFDYLDRFDGFDINGFFEQQPEQRNLDLYSQNHLCDIFKNIPCDFTELFLRKLFALADMKKLSVETLIFRNIDYEWRQKDPTRFIFDLLYCEFIDNQGEKRIENLLTEYTNRLSDAKLDDFKAVFLQRTIKSHSWNCYHVLRSDNPYAFTFVQSWLNDNQCMPPAYLHNAIELGAMKILEFLKTQPGFDINYTEETTDKVITWSTITINSVKEEVHQFIAQCLAETGDYDNITLHELLSMASKTRKNFKPVYKYLNEALVMPITRGNVEIKGMKQARTYMDVFGASPIELLPLVTKDDTKRRLLKELTK